MTTRLSTYTPELGAEICRRIAEGETLLKITGRKRKRGMPGRVTVYDWLIQHENFRISYCIARLAQAELFAEQVIDIADGVDEGWTGPREIARDRVRVDARRWLAAVMIPHVYERLAELVTEREVEEEPEQFMHRAARIAAILEEARQRTIAAEEALAEEAEMAALLLEGPEAGGEDLGYEGA